MRPVRRGASPRTADFANYQDARADLVSRLGGYCSYCERRIPTLLAVEHIQPKGLPAYAHLAGKWENFLLACGNCNATKGDKDVDPAAVLLPDRDNTFLALSYAADGTVAPAPGLSMAARRIAAATLSLTGLDKRGAAVTDSNGKHVALDRVAQRMEAWLLAADARSDVEANPGIGALRRHVVNVAKSTGFFSIWMTAFAGDVDMRNRLIDAFPGTRQSECFAPGTAEPCSPAPNPDRLPHGSKA